MVSCMYRSGTSVPAFFSLRKTEPEGLEKRSMIREGHDRGDQRHQYEDLGGFTIRATVQPSVTPANANIRTAQHCTLYSVYVMAGLVKKLLHSSNCAAMFSTPAPLTASPRPLFATRLALGPSVARRMACAH